jgi:hypothetical protein
MLSKLPPEVTLEEPDKLPVPFTTWLEKYLAGRKTEAYQQLNWEYSITFVTHRLEMLKLMSRKRIQ